MTYEDAGVSIESARRWVEALKGLAKVTVRPEVMSDIGGFGGLFSLRVEKYKSPVLVATTDGVGTKLKIAVLAGKHDTVGNDLVAMCVNDLVAQGAEPLFFLDYLAVAKLDHAVAMEIMKGIVAACREAGCALLGGETAQMPDMYKEGEYDLAGFAVGIVESSRLVDGSGITVGQRIVGIASSGLHSNGYSLARRVLLDKMGLRVNDYVPDLGCSLGEELLKPTRIYAKAIHNILRDYQVSGLAHITGGGLTENVPRILPVGCRAVIYRDSWDVPAIFKVIQDGGEVSHSEMVRTFNTGIGMALVCPGGQVEDVISRLAGLGERAFLIGEIVSCGEKESRLEWQ